MLLKRQLCTVSAIMGSQDRIMLTRKSDGKWLGDGFKAADLAAPARGGTLLHLSLELHRPVGI